MIVLYRAIEILIVLSRLHLHQLCLSVSSLEVFIVEQMMEALRERYFGPTFELHSHDKVRIINLLPYHVFRDLLTPSIGVPVFSSCLFFFFIPTQYQEIWDLDEKDPFMRPEGGESADDVVSRLATAMESMEAEYQR